MRVVTNPNADHLYGEICTAVRTTDEISFKLLGLVPFVTGSAILASILKGDLPWLLVLFVGAFGTVVTLALFMWEWRNITTCVWLRDRAAEMEERDFGLELGQFRGRSEPHKLLGILRMGKTQAEIIVYIATIWAWISLPFFTAFAGAPH